MHNDTIGPVYTQNWVSGHFNYSAPMQQSQALDLFISNIPQGMKCIGDKCNFDPDYPPYPYPPARTCKPNPCPPGQDCCEYYGAFTCCGSDQVCSDTICVPKFEFT
jgi:hypothetical protein